ncbi:hypothetical protein CCAND38_310025 [Capnocytophaga canis]|uniref:Uncharacterized protein n=1 Tax=Capnocytophaga canis TaxID=1848903 RepID=A0A0B7I7Q4_9FLAO|nr:hypothetical protein CCAND38_310025 [Capnocytophaga canis]
MKLNVKAQRYNFCTNRQNQFLELEEKNNLKKLHLLMEFKI